jgi:hypothetical protein
MSEETTKVDLNAASSDDTIKINLDESPEQKVDDSVTKVNLNTAQDEEKQEVPASDQQSKNEESELQLQEEVKDDSVLEIVQEEEQPQEKVIESKEENVTEEVTKEDVIEQAYDDPKIELPENIQKVVDFMNETGGTLEDYVRLNADYNSLDDATLLKEYYKSTKPHLDSEEIDFLLEDNFSFDEDMDEERDIRRKKLAYKEEIAKAKEFLESTKAKYYEEVKLGSKLLPEQQKAIEFFNRYEREQSEIQQVQKKQVDHFIKQTEQVFSEDFKGFEFKVGDSKYRYKVNDVAKTKEVQSDINNVISKFLDENNMIADASGYHKALFAANNADSLATHFYEQGKADAIKQISNESKNVNMDTRKTSSGVVEANGIKVRAIAGDDSSKLRIKMKK